MGDKRDGSSRYQWVEGEWEGGREERWVGEGRGEAMVKVVWGERMDGGGEREKTQL